MHPTSMRGLAAGAATAALAVGALLGPVAAGASAAPTTTVLAGGLQSPHYLQYHDGSLYVAESGRGGTHCTTGTGTASEAVDTICAGATAKIAKVDASGVSTYVGGLPSAVDRDTHEVLGPMSIAFGGRRPTVLIRDTFVGPTGISGIASPFGPRFGKLWSVGAHHLTAVGNIARFATTHPQSAATFGGLPGETLYDSDPHDAVAYRGGYATADAGANDVVWTKDGRTTLLARLPTTPLKTPKGFFGKGSPSVTVNAQAVPSSVAVGPDGALYVGILRGQPALPGSADVYRIVPGHSPVAVVTGLSRVSDVGFDAQGRLLILEQDAKGGNTPGALLRATPNGDHPVAATDLGVTGLTAPVGLAAEPDGSVAITNDTEVPGKGEIVLVHGLS